jgi:D-glycero-alpha-D-manno-heptose 1-phosphate guanylyltransferase
MLPIDGRPFIEYLVRQLASYGIGTIVISCGYLGDAIRRHFGDGERWGVEIRYSSENKPLGTGGATRLASGLVEDETFLLLNGDSICEMDFRALLDGAAGDLIGTMTLTRVPDGSRYGTVELGVDGLVSAFHADGSGAGPALVNAGVYAFRKDLIRLIPRVGPSSLERDILPSLMGRIGGVVSDGYFIDMGVPETYDQLKLDPGPLARVARPSQLFG